LQSKFAKQRFISFLKAGIPFGIPAFSVIYCGVTTSLRSCTYLFLKIGGRLSKANFYSYLFGTKISFFFWKMVGDFQKAISAPTFLEQNFILFSENGGRFSKANFYSYLFGTRMLFFFQKMVGDFQKANSTPTFLGPECYSFFGKWWEIFKKQILPPIFWNPLPFIL